MRGVLAAVVVGTLALAGGPAAAQDGRPRPSPGWKFFFQKEYDQALKQLQQDLRSYPHAAALHDGVGWCHYFLGDLAAAEHSFRRALEKERNHRFSEMGLTLVAGARTAAVEAAESLLAQGEVRIARLAYAELQDPRLGAPPALRRRVLLGHARALLTEPGGPGELKQAARIYRDLLRREPRSVEANQGLGRVLLRQRRHRQAEAALGKALAASRGGGSLTLRLEHAYAAGLRRRHAHALARYQEILKSLPGAYAAHLGCARSLLAQRRPRQALDHLRHALSLSPSAATLETWTWIVERGVPALRVDYAFACLAGGWTAAAGRALAGVEGPEAGLARGLAALQREDWAAALAAVRTETGAGKSRRRTLVVVPSLEGRGGRVTVCAPGVRAWALLGLGEIEAARAAFAALRAELPDDADVLTGLGRVHLAREDYAKAEEFFRGALQRVPGYRPAQTGLSRVSEWRYAVYNRVWALIRAGELDLARDLVRRLREPTERRFPEAQRHLLAWTQGHLDRLEGKAAAALKHFENVAKAAPRFGEGLVGLGWARLETGDGAGAVSPLEAAIGLDHTNTEARSLLIKALTAAGRSRQAEARLVDWVGRATLDADLAERAARLLIFRERGVEAGLALRTLAALEPDRIKVSELEGWRRRWPGLGALYGVLGWALHGRGRHPEARQRFERALALEPGDPTHRRGLACVHSAGNRHREAQRYANEYMDALPRTLAGYGARRSLLRILARDRERGGDHRLALRHYGEIESLDLKTGLGTTAERTANLCAQGRCWRAEGRMDRARMCYLKALGLDAGCTEARGGLNALPRAEER